MRFPLYNGHFAPWNGWVCLFLPLRGSDLLTHPSTRISPPLRFCCCHCGRSVLPSDPGVHPPSLQLLEGAPFFNFVSCFFVLVVALFRSKLGQVSQRLCLREPTEREQNGRRSFCRQRLFVVLVRGGICSKNRNPRWTRKIIYPHMCTHHIWF